MSVCHSCGYTTAPKKQSNEAKMYFRSFPLQLQDQLKTIYLHFLKRNIPKAQLNKDWNKLIYCVEVTPNDIVRTSIAKYLQNEYHIQGKGLAYLKAIINTDRATLEQKKEYEKTRYGTSPPLLNKKG